MGFTGKKALEWKLKYIEAFNEMENQLKERQSIQWQQTRMECKKVRKLETEEIRQLVQYVQLQGSKSAEKYYLALSKLANKTIGLSGGQSRRFALFGGTVTLRLHRKPKGNLGKEGVCYADYGKIAVLVLCGTCFSIGYTIGFHHGKTQK